jgi:hypothetical protein
LSKSLHHEDLEDHEGSLGKPNRDLRDLRGKNVTPLGAASVLVALLYLVPLAAQRSITVGVDVSLPAVVAAAAAYVKQYEQTLTYIVADELYRQQIRGQVPLVQSMPRSRVTQSEIFFMFAPEDRGWMAIRDVAVLDGKPLEGRPDLKTALQILPATAVAGAFKSYNSRFNLGRVVRNFNEPTLSLLVMDERHLPRFAFERKRVERAREATLVTVEFTEKTEPTLIRDLNLQSVFSTGELTVEAGTGRIRKAVLRVTIGSVRMEFTTDYALDRHTDLWVPTSFRERYEDGIAGIQPQTPAQRRESLSVPPTQYEEIICDAKYTNFRRFETTGRIKKIGSGVPGCRGAGVPGCSVLVRACGAETEPPEPRHHGTSEPYLTVNCVSLVAGSPPSRDRASIVRT